MEREKDLPLRYIEHLGWAATVDLKLTLLPQNQVPAEWPAEMQMSAEDQVGTCNLLFDKEFFLGKHQHHQQRSKFNHQKLRSFTKILIIKLKWIHYQGI